MWPKCDWLSNRLLDHKTYANKTDRKMTTIFNTPLALSISCSNLKYFLSAPLQAMTKV